MTPLGLHQQYLREKRHFQRVTALGYRRCICVNDMLTKAPAAYQAFLHAVVLPNMTLFSLMVEWGETLVGVSLLLGLFSRFGAIGGLFLVTNYFMGNGAGSLHDGWFGIDAATFTMTALHVIVPTGLFFGLDTVIRSRTARGVGAVTRGP